MKSKVKLCGALCATALTLVPASGAGITLSVNPVQPSVAVGETTRVDLTISGLGNMTAPSLSAFDLDFLYNPSVLSIAGSIFGSSTEPFDQLDISGPPPFTQIGPFPGDLQLQEVSFDTPKVLDTQQLGAFTLAEVTVEGKAVGNSALSINVNALGDALGNPLSANATGATLTVTSGMATPEPQSLALLGVGLVGLFLAAVRRRSVSHKDA